MESTIEPFFWEAILTFATVTPYAATLALLIWAVFSGETVSDRRNTEKPYHGDGKRDSDGLERGE